MIGSKYFLHRSTPTKMLFQNVGGKKRTFLGNWNSTIKLLFKMCSNARKQMSSSLFLRQKKLSDLFKSARQLAFKMLPSQIYGNYDNYSSDILVELKLKLNSLLCSQQECFLLNPPSPFRCFHMAANSTIYCKTAMFVALGFSLRVNKKSERLVNFIASLESFNRE